jgi:hypothetical protein
MKSLSVKLGVILVGLVIFSHAEVWGADWKLFSADDEVIQYYDAQSIKYPSKNIVEVWTRMEYTDKGKIDLIKDLGNKYVNLKCIMMLEEINCSDKKRRVLSLSSYSKEGKIIEKDSTVHKWTYIDPDSVAELLHKAVCK